MSQERQRERKERASIYEVQLAAKQEKAKQIENVKTDLYALFSLEGQPQLRGKHLEKVLNGLFSAYGILINEDFKRVDPDGAGIIEQVDGVVEFSGNLYLVEMKWVKEPIGVDKISQHLVRLFSRSDARGLFIASDGYTASSIVQCREALAQRNISLITLHEIVRLLERQGDLVQFLNEKIQAAILNKNPFHEIMN